jgi:hypothetical protein
MSAPSRVRLWISPSFRGIAHFVLYEITRCCGQGGETLLRQAETNYELLVLAVAQRSQFILQAKYL